jgi:hypothetical protein
VNSDCAMYYTLWVLRGEPADTPLL